MEGLVELPGLHWSGPSRGAGPCGAIRKGDWELIEFLEDSHVELYNLKEDLGAKNDLASTMRAKAKELRHMPEGWRKEADVQMPKPNPKYRP